MNKLNANVVGANCVRPNYKGMNQNKGITLIALIITIIVMLILVGVTVNVALNRGLFTKADEAAKQTQKETDKEELASAIAASIGIDGKLNLENLKNNLPEGWSENNGIYTSPKGNTYTLDTNGKIIEGNSSGGENSSVVSEEDLKKYLLGADGKGRNFEEMVDEYGFVQDPEDTGSTIHEKIKVAYGEEGEKSYIYYIRFNREIYKFEVSQIDDEDNEFYGETWTVEDSFKKVSNAPEGNLGKYVEYAGNTWIVLRENSSEVELISATPTMKTEVAIGDSDFDKARNSYNNAVETLIQECKNVCREEYGIEIGEEVTGIRCVGGPSTDQTSSTQIVDFKSFTKFSPISGVVFPDFKVTDNNYLDDYNQMKKIGIIAGDIPINYWLASRCLYEQPSGINFQIREIEGVELSEAWLIDVDPWGSKNNLNPYYNALRPVITLSPGILNNATQTGAIDDPIILN